MFETNKRITINEIDSNSISDENQFTVIINLKISLHAIEDEIDKLVNNGILVYRKRLLNEIIMFTYKYLFIKLSNVIYCHSAGKFKEVMNFQSHFEQFCKYIDDLEKLNYTKVNYYSKRNYVDAYYKSFETEDANLIENTISEILEYSDEKKIIKILNDIIESNIVLDSSLSARKKNKILLPFFKEITCNFFFKDLLEYELTDSELITCFKKFRLNMINQK
ncbi:MAG: hypothetical protein WC662_02675 [Candidatus Paceibacterota bacterium]